MTWIIQPMERRDPVTQEGSGKWDLVARSDEDGGFWPAIPNNGEHPGFDTPEEAAANPEARAIANMTAGIPDVPASMSLDEALEHLKKGHRIARRPWEPGMFVFCEPPHSGLMLKTCSDDRASAWYATSEDLLTNDWHIA